MIDKYPLQWPAGYPRTQFPQRSRFEKRTLTYVTKEVNRQIGMMNGSNAIISSNIPIRQDGLPYIDYQKRTMPDKGVAVYFTYKGKQVSLACDKWDSIEDNLWAISCSIDAMRSLSRWGVSDILDRTFQGFTAIEGPKPLNCWDVLDMNATRDVSKILDRYKELAKKRHPDGGGTAEQFQQLVAAKEKALNFYK